MAQFTDITITRAGLDMIAKSQAGDNLIFTGLKIGDGQISGQSIPDLTDLISVKKEIPINSVTAKNEGHVEILGIIDNEDISVGFFVREIGIYAKINEGGTPALYSYTNAGNYASYISDKSVPMDAFKFKIDLVVGNATNVSFVSDKSIVYVTQENLDAHNNAEDSHPDIREKITKDIAAHNKLVTAHPDIDFVESLSSADDGLHYKMRNGSEDKVIDIVSVGDIAFRYKLAPGWVKLNGATVKRSDYPRLVQFATDNGLWTSTPGSNPQLFGQGDGSTTFVLPDYRNRVIQGGDTVGMKSAGLPNITGWFALRPSSSYNQISVEDELLFSAGEEIEITNNPLQVKTDTANLKKVNFNASAANSIYGASSTVQPSAIVLIPQIKY